MRYVIPCVLMFFISMSSSVEASEKVTLTKDSKGWTMKVSGKPFYVKGITWSTTPIGKKYDYNLYDEDDAAIKAAIKRDMELFKAAGGNTLRGTAPPKWMKYIHETYGMYFIANEFCGRYGLTVNGKYIAKINYGDPATRKVIIDTWKKLATKYKDVPGLLAYAMGNENNYGLEWMSAEIENLPQGERHKAKAKYLYSLFNEIAKEVKKIDPNHPIGIANGDIQYLDMIVKETPELDFIGTNIYRGYTYSDMFDKVKEKMGKPVLITETGCDAFNAVTQKEDQQAQAKYIHANWADMYKNTAGNGGAGNSIGALAFEWADEWWKLGQQVNLLVHDTKANWSNGAFQFDFKAGNNMNEEWFGLCSIVEEEINGAHLITPRASYFVLKEVWKHDPYTMGKASVTALKLDMDSAVNFANKATAATNALKATAKKPDPGKSKKLSLPATIFNDKGEKEYWYASGFMGNTNALKLDPGCTTTPKVGKTCMKVNYNASDNWAGVVWQNPANDWENNSAGGYSVAGAKSFSFWARGEKGGEQVTITFGGDKKGKFPNTAKGGVGKIKLTTEWKQFKFPVDSLDLSRIKNPFTLVVAGSGSPFVFYLDDAKFE